MGVISQYFWVAPDRYIPDIYPCEEETGSQEKTKSVTYQKDYQV